MSEKIILTGTLLIFIGILIVVIGSILTIQSSNTKTNLAIGGFIGPIPFGFFSSKGMFWIWLAIFATLFVIWLILG